jgi:predicted CxxxxCH...CXXCH cytochrome family protein
MSNRLENGTTIICSTCHNQHDSTTNPNDIPSYTRISNVDDAMCIDCHSARNVGKYTDPTPGMGSHPIGATVIYDDTDTRFNSSPTASLGVTNNDQILCSTCHGVHDVDGSLGLAANGNLLKTTNDVSLCTDCHNYGTHNGMDCLDCHQVHNAANEYNNIYLIKDSILTPEPVLRAVKFTTQTGLNSFADGVGDYDGVCEVCHYNDGSPLDHFLNDGSGIDQNHLSSGGPQNGLNCTGCHPHSSNFSPEGGDCFTCHQDNTTYPYLSGNFMLTDAHVTHAERYAYSCTTCHFGNNHNNGTIDQAFNPDGLATRNGLDTTVTPVFNGDDTCSNIYCHSNGRSADRGSEGVADWGFSNSPVSNMYQTTPSWSTGSITACNACHEGPATMPAGPDYTIVEGNTTGQVTSTADYPNTGAHITGSHNSPGQLIILTEDGTYGDALPHSWPFVQCFWCHNNDAGAATGVPKKQGTYGTDKHVDGTTWFYPSWYGYGGHGEYASGGKAPAYYTFDTEAEVNALGPPFVWHPESTDPDRRPSMVPGLGYQWSGPTNTHCGNGKNCW